MSKYKVGAKPNLEISEYDMIQIDMEIPKSCADCPLFGSEDDNYYWRWCKITDSVIRKTTCGKRRLDDCPLKEVE